MLHRTLESCLWHKLLLTSVINVLNVVIILRRRYYVLPLQTTRSTRVEQLFNIQD